MDLSHDPHYRSRKVPLIIVHWRDSAAHTVRWEHTNIMTLDGDFGYINMVSVGWLLDESEEAILICPNLQNSGKFDEALGASSITIPKGCITARSEMKMPIELWEETLIKEMVT